MVQAVGCQLVEDLSNQRGPSVQAGPAWAKTGVTYLPPEKCPPTGCSPRTPGPCAGLALRRGSNTWVWGLARTLYLHME